MMKICSSCKKEKPETEFRKDRNQCLICRDAYQKQYRKNNKKKLKKKRKIYVKNNKEKVKQTHKNWREKNKDIVNALHKQYYQDNKDELLAYSKEYREENKEKLKKQRKAYYETNKKIINKKEVERRKIKYRNDPEYRLRSLVSRSVIFALKRMGGSKRGGSVKDKLPFTIKQLKEHFESLFEPWMNWNNHGKYNDKTWVDDDQSTWTWQIDHIIPQSDLPYSSMDDKNFLLCWALSNLRPLSAKQNCHEGSNRVRHKKKRRK